MTEMTTPKEIQECRSSINCQDIAVPMLLKSPRKWTEPSEVSYDTRKNECHGKLVGYLVMAESNRMLETDVKSNGWVTAENTIGHAYKPTNGHSLV